MGISTDSMQIIANVYGVQSLDWQSQMNVLHPILIASYSRGFVEEHLSDKMDLHVDFDVITISKKLLPT